MRDSYVIELDIDTERSQCALVPGSAVIAANGMQMLSICMLHVRYTGELLR